MIAPTVINLGTMSYANAYERQLQKHNQILESRAQTNPMIGHILTVQHDPVITVTKRPDAPDHITAPTETLERMGVSVEQTDRGGDVTYHGPGQLVCYPIIDLNACKLRIHDYIRVLEGAIIDSLSAFGIEGQRDPDATGVWVDHNGTLAKIAAIGVRVRKWITLHGLSVNIDPDMSHFSLIVPCGLTGRPVVSLKQLRPDSCPSMDKFADTLTDSLLESLMQIAET